MSLTSQYLLFGYPKIVDEEYISAIQVSEKESVVGVKCSVQQVRRLGSPFLCSDISCCIQC